MLTVRTILTDLITSETIQTFKSNKFVVRVAFSADGKYMATASYDHTIVIYESDSPLVEVDEDDVLDDTDDLSLASHPSLHYQELNRIKVDSNPEAILFHPSSTSLLYTLRASHLLYYVDLTTGEVSTKSFNPHPMDTHVSFSVLNMALHPSGKVIAFQTGDNRGTAGERILFYGTEVDETDRLGCIWTGAEGDDFVMPRMDWLPDGSGLM
jgi:WD40 repeat protein